MQKDRKLAYLALLGNVVIWGAALPIVKPALSYITPFQFLFYRFLFAAAAMFPIVLAIWPKHLTFRQLVLIVSLEFLQVAVSLTVLYQALAITPALTASLLGSTAPIFIILGGIFFLKEKEERHEWLGLAVSIVGTFIVIVSSAQNGQSGHSPLGVMLMLGYLISNLAYLLLAKRHYRQINKLFIAGISSIVGLASYALITPLIDTVPPPSIILSQPSALLAVLYMGLPGSALAVALMLFGQSKIEASEATLFTYLQPLIYIPLSVFWLKESVSLLQLTGLLVVVAGVLLAEFRPSSKRRLKIA